MALVETLFSDAEVIRQTKGIGHATRTLVSPNQFPLKLIGCIERADTMKKIDLTGQRFGRLTVVKGAEKKGGRAAWFCFCDCGNEKIIQANHLREGAIRSCGCLSVEKSTTHNMSKTQTYTSWKGMKNRCSNPNNKKYMNYGGRGIKIEDERWLKFENFHKDMGDKPEGLSIDRIDNNKGYYKENCRWATHTEQNQNQGISRNNTSGYVGVRWSKKARKYQSRIGVDCKSIHLGYFNDIEDAKQARINAEYKYWE